ncbi:MAG TPA: DinB family protein [Thermoanaerobaculia bacterium]|nr:DinB family protein [Thermoanaerobaculia bacterium]
MDEQSPQTREELLRAFERQEGESLAYWNAFDLDAFFAPIGESWSPAETVRHLVKSIRPVTKALTMNRLMLRLLFGKPRRASVTYDALRARYQQLLAEGGKAGRFAPSAQSEPDLARWRASIMTNFTRVNRDLRAAIARWPESKLDALQLPHPLLGKLTVREMLFFTLYHQRHHIAVVRRHLAEAGA